MKVTVTIRRAWWVKWLYLPGIVLMCVIGLTPDWDRVTRTIGRGIRLTIKARPDA